MKTAGDTREGEKSIAELKTMKCDNKRKAKHISHGKLFHFYGCLFDQSKV